MDKQLYIEIKSLSDKYASELHSKIDERTEEIKSDDNSHFLDFYIQFLFHKKNKRRAERSSQKRN
ncbi:ApaLI family restriction endonuclease [Treponema porcinum]|uniref:ApaLI family restriction endonuclease n=1 Tax=Treponema porcinum TaxID=261392 RepID=UPI0038B2DA65